MFANQHARLRRCFALSLVASTIAVAACSISRAEEIQLGREYAAQINQQLPIVEDACVNRYVNLLGDRIARQGDRSLDYTFYVVNTDQVNAFALPGGFVYVNTGLIEQTDNLSELAGVLAHEIAHVEERHSAEQIERMQQANVGLALASILLGDPGTLGRAAIQLGGTAVFASFSRDAEREADRVAVDLLTNSGIHPTGLITFFKELLEERERRPGTVEQWFSTHPLTEERIAYTSQVIDNVPASRLDDLIVSTQQYDNFRGCVRRLPPPPE